MDRTIAASLLIFGAITAPAGPVGAAGVVDLSWDACAPVLAQRVRDGAHPYSLYASVLGQDTPHKAYQVYVNVRRLDPATSVPDAWRFDAGGCQGSPLIRIDHLAPAAVAKVCPTFQQGNSLQIKDYTVDVVSYSARAVLFNSYPAGATTTTNPDQRYFLARWEFDHTFSAVGAGTPGEPGYPPLTCGGFEHDLQFTISSASWLEMDGTEHEWIHGQSPVTFCGSCAPTPSAGPTWGAIKSVYRR